MVFSVIVLAHGAPCVGRSPANRARADAAARSLASLVDACVRGLAADALVLGPAGEGLDLVADDAGGTFLAGPDPMKTFAQALAAARCEHVFVLAAGFAPEQGFVDEVADIFAFGEAADAMILRAAPDTLLTRLAPGFAAPVGIIARKIAAQASGVCDPAALARRLKGVDLRVRARRIG